MGQDPRIIEARRLLFEVTAEQRLQEKEAINNEECKCGHLRKHHSISFNINYTGGMCGQKDHGEWCNCRNFLSK